MYNKLNNLAKKAKHRRISSLFSSPNRVADFSTTAAGLYLDFTKQNIAAAELAELIDCSANLNLQEKIQAMLQGEKINNTENRAVLHSILRAPYAQQQVVLGKKLAEEVKTTEKQFNQIVNAIIQGQKLNQAGERFTDVLAMGIGGSFYGCKVGLCALQPYANTGVKVHFLANIDGAALAEKLALLAVDTTLVVVISKTFTTQETLLNAAAVKQWMLTHGQQKDIIAQQWLAVTSKKEKALAFGITTENILPMWDWVGGRFSVWSAVGLPLALAIGIDNFNHFKLGAQQMDEHFSNTPADKNMPILMALLGIWNRNFLNYSALAILPYDHALRDFPSYLQQTDMESNGKSVSNHGVDLTWSTAPIIFGQEGTNAQHAFMQLMHQSDDIIPSDFIVALSGTSQYKNHHQVLVANAIAQAEALMQGKTLTQVKNELAEQELSPEQIKALAPHKVMKGNNPSNTLVVEKLDPQSLGALFALYEHKIFVQGVLWQVNSFDQWGVELGKQLGTQVLAAIKDKDVLASAELSPSSKSLINRYNQTTSR
jgi:glucose-6-phosphate isomerase